MEFSNWLKFTVKMNNPDEERDDTSMRLAIFLHFFRMDIGGLEIIQDCIGTYQHWFDRNHFVMEEYVAYIKIPLDINKSYVWWFNPEVPIFPEEKEYCYVCHRLQTFTESQQRVNSQIFKKDI